MGTRDPKVDAYIAKSADFAQPILAHLREVVHAACPDVEEAMKWSFPNFMYKGMFCSMASFKAHCTFGFWKGVLLREAMGDDTSDEAMGQFGRITALSDLPKDKILARYIKAAMKLNDTGARVPGKSRPKATAEMEVPDDLRAALKKNKKANATFEGFSPSKRNEYVEWITEAKSAATRGKRLETAIEWMAEGKARNWKYVKC